MGFLTDNSVEQAAPVDDPMAWRPDGNILAAIAGSPQQAPTPQAAPTRKRNSVLDILGAIVDAGAEFGGSNAGYREGVARRAEQQNAEIDQSWKEKFNQQKLTKGNNELADDRFARFGQASRGLGVIMQNYGAPGVAKAFPLLAQQMGLSDEEQAIFKASLDADPKATLEMLTAATDPSNTGTPPKEITIYNMLKKLDPTGAKAQDYLDKVATGDGGMTDYQKAQLGLGEKRLEVAERNNKRAVGAKIRVAAMRPQPGSKASGKTAEAQANRVVAAQSAKGVITEMRDAFNRLKNAGGINAKGQGTGARVGAYAKENLPLVERFTSPEGFSAREDLDRLRTTGISSLLPLLGGLSIGGKNIDAAKELDTWRKAIASASDYESAMRALDGFERRINEITAEAARSPAPSRGARPRLVPRNTPAPGKRMKYNPATGRIE